MSIVTSKSLLDKSDKKGIWIVCAAYGLRLRVASRAESRPRAHQRVAAYVARTRDRLWYSLGEPSRMASTTIILELIRIPVLYISFFSRSHFGSNKFWIILSNLFWILDLEIIQTYIFKLFLNFLHQFLVQKYFD